MSYIGEGRYPGQILTWDNTYEAPRWMPYTSAPSIGDVLTWDGSAPSWQAGGFTAGGDLSGTNTSQTVIGLQGRSVAATAPTDGQVLTWNNGASQWEPQTSGGGSLVGFTNDGVTDPSYSAVLGVGAGGSATTVSHLVAVGWNAGSGLTTTGAGDYSVNLGSEAGYLAGQYEVNIGNSAGYYGGGAGGVSNNINIGQRAGRGSYGGLHTNCICIGFFAGYSLDDNIDNIFIGPEAGRYSNTLDGQYAVCIGRLAGAYNEAPGSVFVGHRAGAAFVGSQFLYGNTFIGYYAGAQVTGVESALVGYECGARATTVSGMTALGYRAGYNYNGNGVFIGQEAGGGGTVAVSTAWGSVVIGVTAGYYGSTGGDNVIIGLRAGYGNSTTRSYNHNVIVGRYAGYRIQDCQYNCFLGNDAAYNVTSGSYNFLGGYRAGYTLTTGNENVCVGDYCDTTAVDSTNVVAIGDHCEGPTDSIAIGQDVILTNSNSGMISMQTPVSSAVPAAEFWIGDTAAAITVKAGTFTVHSDERVKKNIEELPYGLDFILGLRPRLFDLKAPSNKANARKHMGFIAQELQKDTGKKGLDGALVNDNNLDSLGVDYNQLVAPLVKAVQELSAQVTDLKKELAEIKAQR